MKRALFKAMLAYLPALSLSICFSIWAYKKHPDSSTTDFLVFGFCFVAGQVGAKMYRDVFQRSLEKEEKRREKEEEKTY